VDEDVLGVRESPAQRGDDGSHLHEVRTSPDDVEVSQGGA
jgi:hypothetical protein